MTTSKGSSAAAAALVILGVLFIGVAVFYAVSNTTFLASSAVHHYKHAAVAIAVAVVCFIAANFVRRRVA